MAKGRKLTTSRSERMLSGYGYSNGYGASSTDASELREEDIWGMIDSEGADEDEDNTSGSNLTWSPRAVTGDGRRRGIPRGGDCHHVGGLSLAFQGSANAAATAATSPRILHQYRGGKGDGMAAPMAAPPRGGCSGHHMATSAPVNVPDWSKIYRVDSVESMHEHDSDDGMEGSEMVPPHEYLVARSQKMSVFEGVGRTLKGRDMRRVRDAVWSRTGFDG